MKTTAYVMLVLATVLAACESNDNTTEGSKESAAVASASGIVERIDIVSDQPGAMTRDRELVNAWGLAFNPMGFAWVSSTEEGVSKVYSASGKEVIDAVEIPGPRGVAKAAPTGQVFNSDAKAFKGDTFIFVTEDGTIAGWKQADASQASLRVDRSKSNAIYKGVTIAHDANDKPLLFATDFHGGKIDVFDADYQAVQTTNGFDDPDLPSSFAPFNVQAIDDSLIVTYAKQDSDKEDDMAGKGLGYVDMFDVTGKLLGRLISKGELDAPWGVALAPNGFAAAPGRLLIGNFGDGRIHMYTLDLSDRSAPSAKLEGTLEDSGGGTLTIDGLWALQFGVDQGGFDANTLYFTAGPAGETQGVFGALVASGATGGSAGSSGSGSSGASY